MRDDKTMSEDQRFDAESLKKSVQQVGRLYPRLVNQDGKVLDGNHRAEVDKDWETKIVQTENRFKELLVRAHAHHRRRVPQEETRALIEEMAEALAKDGVPTTEISQKLADCLPYSENYVRSLIPDVYKNPVKAQGGQKGGEKAATISEQKAATISERKQTVKTSDTISNLVECDNCHMATHILKMKALDNKDFCPACFERFSKMPKSSRDQITEKHTVPVKETWEQRKAVMAPGISKMDEAVYQVLQNSKSLREAGWRFEFQKHYCIKEVVSDVSAIKGDVERPIFFDGDVHLDKEDRDDVNRGLLARRLKSPEVYSFGYSGAYSDVKRDEMAVKIEKVLLEMEA